MRRFRRESLSHCPPGSAKAHTPARRGCYDAAQGIAMQQTRTQASPDKSFRAAVRDEKPLQVAGAINAYTARLAEATGFRALYLSGGGVAANSLGLPDLGISTMEDVLVDVRRITEASSPASARRHRHRLGQRLQHRPHDSLDEQGRRGRGPHRRSGGRKALRPPARQRTGVPWRNGAIASRRQWTRVSILNL